VLPFSAYRISPKEKLHMGGAERVAYGYRTQVDGRYKLARLIFILGVTPNIIYGKYTVFY
jgi:hypothetical protein